MAAGHEIHSQAPYYVENAVQAPAQAEAEQQLLLDVLQDARADAQYDADMVQPGINGFWAGVVTSLATYLIENVIEAGTKLPHMAEEVRAMVSLADPESVKRAAIAGITGVGIGAFVGIKRRITQKHILNEVRSLDQDIAAIQGPNQRPAKQGPRRVR